MKPYRQRLWVAVGVALAAASVAAHSAVPHAGTVSLADHRPVTITFWSSVPGIQVSIRDFEKIYPWIHVDYVNPGAGETSKLLTAVTTQKGAPDVAQVKYDNLPWLVQTGDLLNLSPYGAGKLRYHFYPWAWQQTAMAHGIYGIPQSEQPLVLLYNQQIFNRYDLGVPRTWRQFRADAAILRQKAPRLYFNIDMSPAATRELAALAWANGGQLATLTRGTWSYPIASPAWEQVLNYWNTLAKKGLISDTLINNLQRDQLFAGDKVATEIGSLHRLTTLANIAPNALGQWRVTPLPTFSGKPATGDFGGSADVVTKLSKHPKADLRFIAWLSTTPEAMTRDWIQGRIYPADAAGATLPTMSTPWKYFGNERVGLVFKKAARVVNSPFLWPPIVDYWSQTWSMLLKKAITGHLSWASTLPTLRSSMLKYTQTGGWNPS